MKCFAKHIGSGVVYKVLRAPVIRKGKPYVMYCSLQESVLRGTDRVSPVGTKWVRPVEDFISKFLFMGDDDDVRNADNATEIWKESEFVDVSK